MIYEAVRAEVGVINEIGKAGCQSSNQGGQLKCE